MTLRSNDEIQAALLAYIKSKTSITSVITSTEMREDQWQGTTFTYPAIRIRMISNVPSNTNCNYNNISVSIMVFTEDASSQNDDKIAGIINETLHDKSFVSNGIAFYLRTTNLIPAFRSDIRTWRSEVLMNGIVS